MQGGVLGFWRRRSRHKEEGTYRFAEPRDESLDKGVGHYFWEVSLRLSVLEHARKSVGNINGKLRLGIAYRRAKMLATPARARPAKPPAMEVEVKAAPLLLEVLPVELVVEPVPVPFKVSARAWKAEELLAELSSALTEKTIPFPQ